MSESADTWRNPLRDKRDRRLPRIAGPSGLVIFGVTGDLSKKKLIPAVYDLANRGLLPPGFALIGFGRREWSHAEFVEFAREHAAAGCRTPFRLDVWERLAEGIRFVTGTFDADEGFDRLAALLRDLEAEQSTGGNYAFYLSIPPDDFPGVCRHLDRTGCAHATDGSWRRVVIEKPFGHDLESAKELNDVVAAVFPEESVFRIDHYLGKETVQNVLALRFTNQMFEPVWNRNHVDSVQITMAEDIGLGGRAGYYDGIGAARDVIQNHLIQLLALVAMEEPADFSAASLRAEKIKVLEQAALALPLEETTARGQYVSGWQGSTQVCGLTEEEGYDPDSRTETYAAITLAVHNRRWEGVPFYLRTGKRLGRRVTEIAVIFQKAPHLPHADAIVGAAGQNALVIRVQPDEGITLRFASKVPGQAMEIREVNMDFAYGKAFTESSPEAYERLILDVLLGEPSLFPMAREVELSWQLLDPVIESWAAGGTPEDYRAGTWGPDSADAMLARTGRGWRRP